jgi:UDP-N-acetylglucosamine acyltransferase
VSARIHPTAVVDPRAVLEDGVEVGAHAVVEGPVRLGRGTVLRPHAVVVGETTMGAENMVFSGAVLGERPQDLKYAGERTTLEIGDRNHFREHVTVHAGTAKGGGVTRIGSGGLFMAASHVAHDGVVGDGVVLANAVLLAGHVRVGDRAVIAGAAAFHHFTTIGRLAYVGGLSRVVQDVHPFTIVEGHPARIRGANSIGMERAGIAREDVEIVRRLVFQAFLSRRTTTEEALSRFESEHPGHPLVAEVVRSVRAAQEGRQGRAQEPLRRVATR